MDLLVSVITPGVFTTRNSRLLADQNWLAKTFAGANFSKKSRLLCIEHTVGVTPCSIDTSIFFKTSFDAANKWTEEVETPRCMHLWGVEARLHSRILFASFFNSSLLYHKCDVIFNWKKHLPVLGPEKQTISDPAGYGSTTML